MNRLTHRFVAFTLGLALAAASSVGAQTLNYSIGSLAFQNANSVAITGGTVSGVTITAPDGTAAAPSVSSTNSDGLFFPAASAIGFATGGAERMRVSGSRLLIGHTASLSVGSVTPPLQVHSTAASGYTFTRWSADVTAPTSVFGKSRGATVGDYTIVQSDDGLGTLRFAGSDGSDLDNTGATIAASVDASPSLNVVPGRLTFSTTTTGGASQEAMRITSAQRIGVGTTAPSGRFDISGSQSGTPSGSLGSYFSISGSNSGIFTDNATAASGTASGFTYASMVGQLTASNTNVTTSVASVFKILQPLIARTNETITASYGLLLGADNSVANGGTVTNAYGFGAAVPTGATNNWAGQILSPVTGSGLMMKSARAAIVSTNVIGGHDYFSDDTNLTSPGSAVARMQARATETHTASALGTSIVWSTTPNASTTIADSAVLDGSGNFSTLGSHAIGTTSAPAAKLQVTGNASAAAWTTNGIRARWDAATYTDTSSSGTVASIYVSRHGAPTLAASSSTTYTNAATLAVAEPVAGTNVTLTNKPAIHSDGDINLASGKTITLANVAQRFPKTFTAVYDPASLAAGTSRCDDVTVTGITTTGGAVAANIGATDPNNGCVIASVRASATDTVRVCWRNAVDTVQACDTTSSTWTFTQAQ